MRLTCQTITSSVSDSEGDGDMEEETVLTEKQVTEMVDAMNHTIKMHERHPGGGRQYKTPEFKKLMSETVDNLKSLSRKKVNQNPRNNRYNRGRRIGNDADWRNVHRGKRNRNYTAHNTGSAADYNIPGSEGKKMKAAGYVYDPNAYPPMRPIEPKSKEKDNQISTENRYNLLRNHDDSD